MNNDNTTTDGTDNPSPDVNTTENFDNSDENTSNNTNDSVDNEESERVEAERLEQERLETERIEEERLRNEAILEEFERLLNDKPVGYLFDVEEILRKDMGEMTPHSLLLVAIRLLNKTEDQVAVKIVGQDQLAIPLDNILGSPGVNEDKNLFILIEDIDSTHLIPKPFREKLIGQLISLSILNGCRFLIDKELSDKKVSNDPNLDEIYLFKDRMVYEISSIKNYIKKVYALSNTQNITTIANKIEGMALRHYERIKFIKAPYEYDVEKQVSVVMSGRNHYILDGTNITKYQNGDNDIIVNDPITKDFDFDPNNLMDINDLHGIINIPDFAKQSALLQIVCSRTNFDEIRSLGMFQQQLQQTFYFFSMFFGELIRTKPIAIIDGQTASGKTLVYQIFEKITKNPSSELEGSSVRTDREIETAISNIGKSKVMIFDNVDNPSKDFTDMLIKSSTGVKYGLRTAFQKDSVDHDLRNFTVVTTRRIDKLASKDDFIDRSIIFRYKAFEKSSVTEGELLSPVYNNYSSVKSELMMFMNLIVSEIRDNWGTTTLGFDSTSRFKDYLKINKIIARVLDIEDSVFQNSVTVLEKSVVEFNLENVSILDSIKQMIGVFKNEDVPAEYKASEMTSADILNFMKEFNIDNRGFTNPGTFTSRLKGLVKTLEQIGITILEKKGKRNSATVFVFDLNHAKFDDMDDEPAEEESNVVNVDDILEQEEQIYDNLGHYLYSQRDVEQKPDKTHSFVNMNNIKVTVVEPEIKNATMNGESLQYIKVQYHGYNCFLILKNNQIDNIIVGASVDININTLFVKRNQLFLFNKQ